MWYKALNNYLYSVTPDGLLLEADRMGRGTPVSHPLVLSGDGAQTSPDTVSSRWSRPWRSAPGNVLYSAAARNSGARDTS